MHRGSLEDLGSLRSGAAGADGVIHAAFIHDFNNYAPAAEADRRAVETLGAALIGSDARRCIGSMQPISTGWCSRKAREWLPITQWRMRGIPTREIAQVIGRCLNVPIVSKSREKAADHFGWIAHFFAIDGAASSAQTQKKLGWRPQQPGLIADLDRPSYFAEVSLSASSR